jgi:hypothetical protein
MARLFHSLVVCGAGLTLVHCGGRSAGHGDADEASGTSQGSAAGNGDGGRAGTTTAQGGASAGALSLGGALSVPSGGSAGAPTDARRPSGPTEQWGCDASGISCSGERFNVDYRDCARDQTRPRRVEDCPAGTMLTCLKGYLDDEAVLFNCACSPPEADGCACPEVLDSCSARVEPPQTCGQTSECGCAITCILR